MKKNVRILKEFGERYKLIEHEDGYLLYDNEGKKKRSNAEYLGRFIVSDGEYVFNGVRYGGVGELVDAMKVYNDGLPFDAEIYNPIYRKHVMIEMALHDYLNKLGFKDSKNGSYNLEDVYGEVVGGIRFEVTPDTTEGIVVRDIGYNKWFESRFTDLESAIGCVNSIVATYCCLTNSLMVGVLGKLTGSRASGIYYKMFDMGTMNVYVEDAKKKAIEYLKKELKRLEEDEI